MPVPDADAVTSLNNFYADLDPDVLAVVMPTLRIYDQNPMLTGAWLEQMARRGTTGAYLNLLRHAGVAEGLCLAECESHFEVKCKQARGPQAKSPEAKCPQTRNLQAKSLEARRP